MKLGVNIDHVATLRQARRGKTPDPGIAASICEKAGADSIVAHLREDRRHINDRDVMALKQTVRTKFNLEMSASKEIVSIACKIKPDQATLVPEKRQELTTEGGLDVVKNFRKTKNALRKLESKGIEASLFIDPDKKQILAAKKAGASMIELHTGRFADAKGKFKNRCLKDIASAVKYAHSLGLVVNAGHGLDYSNVKAVAGIKGIEELNIGYSIICRSLFVGLKKAVEEMKALI